MNEASEKREQLRAGQILRKKELLSLLKISDPTLWRLEHAGDFPRRFRIGPGCVGWDHAEILDWLEAKKVAARSAAR